jgi:hypothetical protein|tara:strand:+ start:3054 stop:3266 length:213 start_codon:yes stop_codon:yes gene_type:complete
MNSVKFYSEIEKIKRQKRDMSYMDAVVWYCEENDIEIETVGKFISKTLKEKIELEARDLNYLPKVGKLPV